MPTIYSKDPPPLYSIPWIPPAHCPKSLYPILAHTLSVWDAIKYSACLIYPRLPPLPLLNCPLFPPGMENPSCFQWWRQKGLTTVRSLLVARGVCSFRYLRDSYEISELERFRYIQIHHFVESLTRHYKPPLLSTAFETRCRTNPTTQGLITLLYSSILNIIGPQTLMYSDKWFKDFGSDPPPGDWRKMWKALFKSSRNVLIFENSFKVVSDWYFTPTSIVKCLPSYLPNCFRGCKDLGDMKHIW